MENFKPAYISFTIFILGFQVIKEQGIDHLVNVLFAGIVCTKCAALVRIHDRLEHGPEYCWADGSPIHTAATEQVLSHLRGEASHRQLLGKQLTVHIRERCQVFRECSQTLLWGCI